MTGAAEIIFPKQANGSLVTGERQSRRLVRSSGSFGRSRSTSRGVRRRPEGLRSDADRRHEFRPDQREADRVDQSDDRALKKENPDASGPPPMDLVTSSASGIDPDISPEAAYWEAPRVAKARHMSVDAVNAIVARTSKAARSDFSASRTSTCWNSIWRWTAYGPTKRGDQSSGRVSVVVSGRISTRSSRAPASSKRRANEGGREKTPRLRCVPASAIVVSRPRARDLEQSLGDIVGHLFDPLDVRFARFGRASLRRRRHRFAPSDRRRGRSQTRWPAGPRCVRRARSSAYRSRANRR